MQATENTAISPSYEFPWRFFALSWVLLFAYLVPINPWVSADLGDIVNIARSGNLITQILGILLGAVGITVLLKRGRSIRLCGAVGAILTLYLVWISLSVIWSADRGVTIRRGIAFGLMLAYCAACTVWMKDETLALFVAAIASLNGLAALVQEFIAGTFHPFESGYRFGGTLSPNTQGAGLSIALIITVWFALKSQGRTRGKSICAALVLMLFIWMTGSRTCLLGIIAALAVLGLLTGFRRYRHEPVLIGAVVMFVCAVSSALALVQVSDALPRETSHLTNVLRTERDGDAMSELTGRDQIWEVCFRYVEERPLLGFGYGGFWTANRIDAVASETGWPASHAHSAYLDTLLQLGVPGLCFYVLLLGAAIVTAFVRFLRHDNVSGCWAALLVFAALNGLTESSVLLPSFLAFVFCFSVLSLALNSRRMTAIKLRGSCGKAAPLSKVDSLAEQDLLNAYRVNGSRRHDPIFCESRQQHSAPTGERSHPYRSVT